MEASPCSNLSGLPCATCLLMCRTCCYDTHKLVWPFCSFYMIAQTHKHVVVRAVFVAALTCIIRVSYRIF